MPVSAALLVSGAGPNSPVGGVTSSPTHFIRGEKATSSVKLRRRNKDDYGAPASGNYQALNARNKKNRHSCDFSVLNDRSQSVNYLQNDFDYITFPNGVPVVHGLCVTGEDFSDAAEIVDGSGLLSYTPGPPRQPQQSLVNNNGDISGAGRRQRSTTSVVHITHRDSPQHFKYSRPVSSSAMNIHHQPLHVGALDPSRHQPRQGATNNHFHHAAASHHSNHHRRSSPSHSPTKYQARGSTPVRMQNRPVQSRQSPSSHFMITKDNVPLLPSHHNYHLQQQQQQHHGGHRQQQPLDNGPARGSKHSKATKPAENEFEFKLNVDPEELDKQAFLQLMKHGILGLDKKAGSQESGIFSTGSSQESPSKSTSRQPGLGRRAITQLNLREKKSQPGLYSGELARSQENVRALVPDTTPPSDTYGVGGAHAGVADDLEMSIDYSSTLRKGLLWQQRDKLFSSWKERYFILTQDFLQCFKKETSRITDMGGFLFKIKLCDVESVDLLDKKGYLTICLNLFREPKMFLRKTEGIRDWYNCICNCVKESKARKQLRSTSAGSNPAHANHFDQKQATDSSGIESYVFNKRRLNFRRSDSTPEIHKNEAKKERITLDELSNLYKNEEEAEKRKEEVIMRKRLNRLSLMTDMEMMPDFSKVQMNRQEFWDSSNEGRLSSSRQEADSGHNSLNTNRSAGSTISSKHSMGPIESHFPEMEEEDEECTLTQTPVTTPATENGPKSLCDPAATSTVLASNRLSLIEGGSGVGPRSLAVGVIQEEDVTISCSMPSPKIKICSSGQLPHKTAAAAAQHENKNVIEVRYRERSSPRTSAGAKLQQQQQNNKSNHYQSQAASATSLSNSNGGPTSATSSPRDSKAHVNRLQITHV